MTAAPFASHAEPVRPEWIDYNGHMNVAYYVVAFDNATEHSYPAAAIEFAFKAARPCMSTETSRYAPIVSPD